MRVLFYGAGVIGSLYAAKFADAGIDTSILARGGRYGELVREGLKIKSIKSRKVECIQKINIVGDLLPGDKYDFIFVAVQKNQVDGILPVLKENISPNIVFMVNNPSGPQKWADYLGENRVLIAFPGAGGKREDGVVHYHVVAGIIQPTTMGEIGGKSTVRIKRLYALFKQAGFTAAVSRNIVGWQLSHVAMVSPMAGAIYMDGGTNYSTSRNKEAIRLMNLALKEGFRFLKEKGFGINPPKMRLFLICPLWMMNLCMRLLYGTGWAETVIADHALAAREEMRVLAQEFISLAEKCDYDIPYFKKLASYNPNPQNI